VADHETRIETILKRGDAMEILRTALHARTEYERGNVCQCAEPALFGGDLMCGECLLEHQGQRDKREAAIREPHPFVESDRPAGRRLDWCGQCTMPRTDPRHHERTETPSWIGGDDG